MSQLRRSESIFIARSPEALYDMVWDITRMGEWSPVCKAGWWDEGAGPEVGAWFTGRNELPESWEYPPDGIAMFEERFGAAADDEIEKRIEAARSGISATLRALKEAAEASETGSGIGRS